MSKEVQSSVRDLVSQIKSGEKNRPDAFQELREVLLQSRARNSAGGAPAQAQQQQEPEQETSGDGDEGFDTARSGGAPATSATTPTLNTQFTRESRHAIISQIIEKKKQQRQMMKNNPPEPDTSNQYTDLRSSVDSEGNRTSNTLFSSQNEQSPIDGGISAASYASPTAARMPRRPSTGSQARPQSAGRAQSGQRARSRSSGPALDRNGGGRAVDDLQLSTKDLRTLQYEARIRNELFKECTFHPKVKRLPTAYGSMKDSDTPFLARVQHWQREKELAAARKKSALEKNEVSECTFKPQLNNVSQKAARELRRSQSHEAISERLYRSSEEIAEHKARFLEEERNRELEQESRECTFQPHLVTSSRKFQHVAPRFDRDDGTAKELPESPSAKECTFTPKIKGVRKNMDSAAMYLSVNVVDRLTRPFGSTNQSSSFMSLDDPQRGGGLDPDRPVMDVAAFMGSLSGGQPAQRPSSAPRERTSPTSAAANKMNFEAFLNRQMQTELRKQKEISETLNSVTPSFTPAINRRSISLASSISRGDFLERVDRDSKRRHHDTQKKQVMSQEPFSFQPELSAKAEKMRPRSSYELSRGDLLKRETAHRMLKLRLEQEELQKNTYRPELSRMAKSMKSSLQLDDQSESYVDRVRAANQEKESMRLSILKEREHNETLDCTFKPVTRDCPAYVKRIARSLSIVKSARVTHASAPAKPEWR